MSVVYCEYCHEYVDLDFNVEHFDDDGETCIKQLEDENS